jgi:hypothetical protein
MINWQEKYRILRLAAVLAIKDIKCGYTQKALLRLETTVKALDLKSEPEEDNGD